VTKEPAGAGAAPWRAWGLPAPKSEASLGDLSLAGYEVYSGIEVHAWPFFVRLDGWKFHGLAQRLGLAKPFDRRMPDALARAARPFFPLFNATLCYIFSDEVNLLFLEPTAFRRIEKLDSVFAGLLSAHFSALIGTAAVFDCRVIPVGWDNVLPYLVWRQAECWRNHNNAWAQWAMTAKAGRSRRDVSRRLGGLKSPDLSRLCEEGGIDLRSTPLWQRRGVLLHVERYRKPGYDPITRTRLTVERRRPTTDWAVRRFDTKEGARFLTTVLQAERAGVTRGRSADVRRSGR
jgi:tRNA(His) 5'-end guanylyltransferase